MLNKLTGNKRSDGQSQDRANRDEAQLNTPIMNIATDNRIDRNSRNHVYENMRTTDSPPLSSDRIFMPAVTTRSAQPPVSYPELQATTVRQRFFPRYSDPYTEVARRTLKIEAKLRETNRRNQQYIRRVVEKCIVELNANSCSPLDLRSSNIRNALDNEIYRSLQSKNSRNTLIFETEDSTLTFSKSIVFNIVNNFFAVDRFEQSVIDSLVQAHLSEQIAWMDSHSIHAHPQQFASFPNQVPSKSSIDEQASIIQDSNFLANDCQINMEALEIPLPIVSSVIESTDLPLFCRIADGMIEQGILFIPAKINSWLNPIALRESLSVTHNLQELSGAGSNCWWRSAWIIILTTADPKTIFNKITELKTQCTSLQNEEDPKHLINPNRFLQSAILARTNIADVLTQLSVSRIKYHDDQFHLVNDGVNEELQPIAEEHLKLLTFEILKKISIENNGGEISEGRLFMLRQQVFENFTGDQLQIRELLQFFESNFVMLSVNASESLYRAFSAQSDRFTSDSLAATETRGVWFGLRSQEQQSQLELQFKEGNSAEEWNNIIESGWRDLPVLKININHFDVYFPKSFSNQPTVHDDHEQEREHRVLRQVGQSEMINPHKNTRCSI